MATLLRVVPAMLLLVALASCGRLGGESSAHPVPVDEAVSALEEGATVVDVRTPEEYDAGHLPDALNISVTADDFQRRVAELDPEASYVVYCASGNRAGAAVEAMRETGFTDVVNGGGYDDLVSAGAG